MKRLRNHIIFTVANALRSRGVDLKESKNPQVKEMQSAIASLNDHSIQFLIERYPDGSWSAESTNLDGIMTGSKDLKEAPELIKDAVFTYFEIPPHLCNEALLRSDNEPVTVKQNVRVGA